LTVPSGGIT
jgi:hypothetical protein